jgi:hypothetical protein
LEGAGLLSAVIIEFITIITIEVGSARGLTDAA